MRGNAVVAIVAVGLSVFAVAGCAADATSSEPEADDEVSELNGADVFTSRMHIAGPIAFQHDQPVRFDGAARYVALTFSGSAGDQVRASVSSRNGTPEMWILEGRTGHLEVLDHETGKPMSGLPGTQEASAPTVTLGASGTHYLVVRELRGHTADLSAFVYVEAKASESCLFGAEWEPKKSPYLELLDERTITHGSVAAEPELVKNQMMKGAGVTNVHAAIRLDDSEELHRSTYRDRNSGEKYTLYEAYAGADTYFAFRADSLDLVATYHETSYDSCTVRARPIAARGALCSGAGTPAAATIRCHEGLSCRSTSQGNRCSTRP